jgi:hypothetical protein
MSEQNDNVKLPSLEEIREQVLASSEIQPVPEAEPVFKTTLTTEQAAAATAELRGKSFSGRHPELGKMVNCQVHGFRHRQFEFDPTTKCEQKFTHTLKDKDGRKYEQFREEVVPVDEEKGVPESVTLVPDLRTAIHPDSTPTLKQVLGAAQFAKKRFHPHPSKIKLQFIERTRVVFNTIGFYLLDETSDKFKELTPEVQALVQKDFQEDLQRARVIAARQIRKERRLSSRGGRRRQDQSRRVNRGLKLGRNLA